MRKPKYAAPSPQVANQMLDNVFSSCGQEPNTVSLEVLVSYSNYRKERFIMQRGLIAAVLTLFLLLPILFITAAMIITVRNPEQPYNPEYEVKVEGRMPISSLNALIDGRPVTVTETGDREYLLQPTRNGIMIVTVTLINRQMTSEEVVVSTVDMTQPYLTGTEYDDAFFYLFVEDRESGVDYGFVRGVYEDGSLCDGILCDTDSGKITIPYPKKVLSLIIPDRGGNELKISLKPQENEE